MNKKITDPLRCLLKTLEVFNAVHLPNKQVSTKFV